MNKMKVLVTGPALTESGYGEHARFVLRSLKDRDNVELYFIPTRWGGNSWLSEITDEKLWLQDLAQMTHKYHSEGGKYDISIQVTIPSEWQQIAPKNIGVTAAMETDKVSKEWLSQANAVNKIIVTSEHSKSTFNIAYRHENSIIRLNPDIPIDVVNFPYREVEKDESFELDLPNEINFLTIAQWGPRKNIEQTVSDFYEECGDKDYGLVVKLHIKNESIMDRTYCTENLSNLKDAYIKRHGKAPKCQVHLLHGRLSEAQMASLFQHDKIKAYITLTHGEGFGLSIFDAARYGLPIIGSCWSGEKDYLTMKVSKRKKKGNKFVNIEKDQLMIQKVQYELKPIQKKAHWATILEPDMIWAYPNSASYRERLNTFEKDYDMILARAKKLQKHVLDNFSEDIQNEKMWDALDLIESEQNATIGMVL